MHLPFPFFVFLNFHLTDISKFFQKIDLCQISLPTQHYLSKLE